MPKQVRACTDSQRLQECAAQRLAGSCSTQLFVEVAVTLQTFLSRPVVYNDSKSVHHVYCTSREQMQSVRVKRQLSHKNWAFLTHAIHTLLRTKCKKMFQHLGQKHSVTRLRRQAGQTTTPDKGHGFRLDLAALQSRSSSVCFRSIYRGLLCPDLIRVTFKHAHPPKVTPKCSTSLQSLIARLPDTNLIFITDFEGDIFYWPVFLLTVTEWKSNHPISEDRCQIPGETLTLPSIRDLMLKNDASFSITVSSDRRRYSSRLN